jgi:hypothetical protein
MKASVIFALAAVATISVCSIARAEPAKCDPDKALWDASLPVSAQQTKVLTEIEKLTDEQLALTNPNAPAGEPVGNSMTKEQVEKFGELRARLIGLQFAALIRDDFERDVILTSRLLKLSKDRYEDKPIGDDDKNYSSILDALTANINDDNSGATDKDGCNLESAIYPLLYELNTKIAANINVVESEQTILKGMATKYKVSLDKLKDTDLSAEDSLISTPIFSRMRMMMREIQYSRDLSHVIGYFEMSQFVYATRLDAIASYGPSANNIDRELDEKSKKMSDQEKKYLAIWTVVNANLPGEYRKKAEATATMVDQMFPRK